MQDALTGLFDRDSFLCFLEWQLSLSTEHQSRLGLLVVDIDHFARHNYILGYANGDLLLKYFALLLERIKRPDDYAARIGDNRFALILLDLRNRGHAELAAARLLRSLEVPFQIDGKSVRVAATIGIALCPEHAQQAEDLVKRGERSLFVARRTGQSFWIPTQSNDKDLADIWDLELDLERAVREQQFVLYYQPKVSIPDGRLIGAEALLRWNHPERGLLSPMAFLGLAEEGGHMKNLTNWVLNAALRQSADWPGEWERLSVAINVSPTVVVHPDFPDILRSAVGLWRGKGLAVVIEITEQTLAVDTERVFRILRDVQAMGIEVSIDDFGTGYSSLSYFKNIPAQELKIDKSFVSGLISEQADADIVHLIIDLAHRFRLRVVAEGVETLDILQALVRLKCDGAQGYLIAKPMPQAAFKKWLLDFKDLDTRLHDDFRTGS